MTDTTFSRDELRALAPADLRGLLELADGETEWQKAISLGLSPTNPRDRVAVIKALESEELPSESFSAPIGAGDSGVRSDRTPDEPEPATAVDRMPDQEEQALSLPEADPEAAADIAAKMQASAATGSPFVAGTFALYATPKGDVVVVVEHQDGTVTRPVIPKKMVRLALGMIAGEQKGIAGIIARKLGRG